jgi:hypothetical protein
LRDLQQRWVQLMGSPPLLALSSTKWLVALQPMPNGNEKLFWKIGPSYKPMWAFTQWMTRIQYSCPLISLSTNNRRPRHIHQKFPTIQRWNNPHVCHVTCPTRTISSWVTAFVPGPSWQAHVWNMTSWKLPSTDCDNRLNTIK